ncbi:MAG: hypothetical protein GC160_16060 [Acidobacteria bacterium]|nr:hypothetical protein [Acidobacteriota bacterium]
MSRRAFTLGVAVVLLVFVATASLRRSPDWFGSVHDDTIYFSTAKAMASGEGFVLPSLPGAPPQTKYPALYPAALALVWLAGPDFPANLDWAWLLNLLFAAAAIAVWAALARQLGCGRREALLLTALAALNPYVVFWSNTLVSDLAFTALAVGGAVAAQAALERRRAGAAATSWWVLAITLLWAACLTRTLGVAFVAGVAALAAWRGAWLPAAATLSACLAPLLKLAGAMGRPALPAAASAWEGFRQNLLYYSSYGEFWKLCVPDWATLERQVSVTLVEILKHPAIAVFFLPATGLVSPGLQLLAITLSVGVLAGLIRRARADGLHPLHLAAIFYFPIILLWNYPLLTRFGLPFLMLFLAGAAGQLTELGRLLRQSWLRGPKADRVVAAAFALGLAALLGYGVRRMLWQAPQGFAQMQRQRAELSEPKQEAYRWLRSSTAPDEVVISYEDGALYLFADRRGMRPASLSTAAFFMQDRAILDHDLAQLQDTALALGARYWLQAPDDFDQESAPELVRARIDELLQGLPTVFSSADGKVRVVDLQTARWAQAGAAESAARRGESHDPLDP